MPRGTEETEFAQPKAAVEQAGGEATVISLETGDAKTFDNDLDPGKTFAVDKAIGDVSATDFDGLINPGGCVGADTLRSSDKIVAFVGDFFAAGKLVAAICHAPWTLIEADQGARSHADVVPDARYRYPQRRRYLGRSGGRRRSGPHH